MTLKPLLSPPAPAVLNVAKAAGHCASPSVVVRGRTAGPAWVALCAVAAGTSLLGGAHLGAAGMTLVILAALAVGLAISRIEYAAGLPVPATPGILFWFGHFLSFVVGGLLFWLLEVDPTLALDVEALAWQIGIVTTGLATFGIGYAIALRSWTAGTALIQWPAVRLDTKALVLGCLALAMPVFGFFLVFPEYQIGAMKEIGAPDHAPVLGVIVFGVLGFVRPVVLVLLGIYLVAEGKRRIAVAGLLALVGLGQTFQATLAGGRAAILETVLACVAVMAAFKVRQNRLGRLALVLAGCIFLVFWYVPTAGQYRTQTAYGGASRQVQPFSEYVSAFLEAGRTVVTDTSQIRTSVDAVVGRLYEPSAFRVMSTARETDEGFGFRGWGDLLFRWVPGFIREKGKDREQDLMWQQGFKPIETSAETLTLPADLYYRFRLPGVVLGYAVMGVVLGGIAGWCQSRLDGTRLVGLMALGVLVSRIYSVDFVHAVWAPVYELPIGIGVALIVFPSLRRSLGAIHLSRITKQRSVPT